MSVDVSPVNYSDSDSDSECSVCHDPLYLFGDKFMHAFALMFTNVVRNSLCEYILCIFNCNRVYTGP